MSLDLMMVMIFMGVYLSANSLSVDINDVQLGEGEDYA